VRRSAEDDEVGESAVTRDRQDGETTNDRGGASRSQRPRSPL